MVTEKQILELKNEALQIRDKIIRAKATYDEVVKNIESYKTELKELNVDIDNIDSDIESMQSKIESVYDECNEIIKKWYKK